MALGAAMAVSFMLDIARVLRPHAGAASEFVATAEVSAAVRNAQFIRAETRYWTMPRLMKVRCSGRGSISNRQKAGEATAVADVLPDRRRFVGRSGKRRKQREQRQGQRTVA